MTNTSSVQWIHQAEVICSQRGVRLTPQRREVLKLIAQQNNAISAYDLLDLLKISEPQAKPPTVYRALDFLLEQGFIHKIESTNSYILCHHFDNPTHTSAIFLCHTCNSVTEKPTDGIEFALQQLALETGFELQHSVVEAHGICQKCRK